MPFGKIGGFVSIVFFLILCPLSVLFAKSRSLDAVSDTSVKIPFLGSYHALIIGIDGYEAWDQLRTPVRDAESLKQILTQRYGFDDRNIVLRTNKEATRLRIINDLRHLASSLGEKDNLLIYYAGHGQLDDFTGDGYWIPVEGDSKDPGTWISHLAVKGILGSEKVKCKNIIVIADSCYAGDLIQESAPLAIRKDADDREALLKDSSRPSRQVVTTGEFKPVVDGPRGGHSLFGDFFLKALEENTADMTDLERLCYKILQDNVGKISGQTFRIGRFNTPMDRGGRFVLFDEKRFVDNETKRIAAERDRKEQEQLTALQAEREKLEAERARLETERKALEEKQNIEARRLKAEAEQREKNRLADELKKREQEQLTALQAEREKLEAERARLETERKALEEKQNIEARRLKIEAEQREKERLAEERKQKEPAQLAALQAEREKIDAERARLEAEKKALEANRAQIDKEKMIAPISGEITGTKVVLRRKGSDFNTVQDIRDLLTKNNFFDSYFNTNGDFENRFVDNGNETITDLATGLMWQKGGSDKAFSSFTFIKKFVESLNKNGFGGFSDWRLPTLDELASLLEPKSVNGTSFVDPVFSALPSSVSADYSSGSQGGCRWLIDFENGHITLGMYFRIDWLAPVLRGANIPHHKQLVYVKAVRSIR